MSAFLDVSRALKNPGQIYPFEISPEIGEMEVFGDPIHFENVVASGEFFGTGARVSVRGHVTAEVHAHCAKCLEPVSEPLQADIDAVLAREIDPEDPDLYYFEESSADFTDLVKDALILELPYRFLCSEDCKGLCTSCGTNLNLGTCTCRTDVDDMNPFAALKAIAQNYEEV